MNIDVAMPQLPSRYPIGSEVVFHPSIERFTYEEARATALRAKVVGVHFSEYKVTYDLALMLPSDDGAVYYEAMPARCVDSLMVMSIDDVIDNSRLAPPAVEFLAYAELRPIVADFSALSSAVGALVGALSADLATASSADRQTEAYAAFASALNARPAQHEQQV